MQTGAKGFLEKRRFLVQVTRNFASANAIHPLSGVIDCGKNSATPPSPNLAGGSPTPIADVLGDTLFGARTVSPDGRFLAYPYQQYSPPFVALAVIPESGGPAQKLFKVPGFVGSLRWSPKGSALQYLLTRTDATNLWEQPLQGGEAKQMTRFNTGRIFDFTWTRDQKHLLLARGQSTRDVVLITGLGNQ